jgi:hypothetical protein
MAIAASSSGRCSLSTSSMSSAARAVIDSEQMRSSSDMERMKVFGKKMRCCVVDNAARGNCMFLAVLGNLGVGQTRENVLDLRNAVADFLATNLDRFADRLRSFQAEGEAI